MQTNLPEKDVLLLGLGHTNAHVLRMWRMKPLPRVRLTCVSNFSVATYSGMLPGVLAGQYPPERMEIDLVRLCAASGARLITASVNGLDVPGQRLLFEDRPSIPFDVLSVGVGSVPTMQGLQQSDDTLLPIKPMQTFLPRLEARLNQAHTLHPGRPLNVVVVGGGAAGVEISFCLQARLRKLFGQQAQVKQFLVESHDSVVSGVCPKTEQLVRRDLESRGIRLLLNRRAVRVEGRQVVLDDDTELDADIALWATSSAPPPLLALFDLPKDEDGFLLTRPTLQTTADAPIFAVGDTGTIDQFRTPKAGVYAVRQGPVLWRNMPRMLRGESLEEYRPQKGFLKLLNTGDGRAIAEYMSFSLHNRLAWKLKDAIDSRFMDKYQDYRPMEMDSRSTTDEPPAQMRCAGCGGKVAGDVLSRVLARLEIPPHENVLLGLEAPDDAAVIQPPGGRPMTLTADFFAAPFDDPYLVGRIAALNAASDVFALGARPIAALALVTLPVGKPRQQEELMFHLMAGSLQEFRAMGATLVGGHTIEGAQLTIGFTVVADQGDRPPQTKKSLRAGDLLILTKPLGTGVLLAAHMQAACRAAWYDELLAAMLASNQQAAALAGQLGVEGLTDVTGFGLAGHLLEMLQASKLAAELQLSDIPLLPGTEDLIEQGVESTLAPANRAAESEMRVAEAQRQTARYKALFDPQTAGGLLIAVAADQAQELLAQLHKHCYSAARIVGRIVPRRGEKAPLQVD